MVAPVGIDPTLPYGTAYQAVDSPLIQGAIYTTYW